MSANADARSATGAVRAPSVFVVVGVILCRTKMPRGGRKTHEFEDQYGASGVGEDAGGGYGGGHGGGSGGGGAGGGVKRSGAKGNVAYTRRPLPKFLQQHAHLLGADDGAKRRRPDDDDEGEDDDEPAATETKPRNANLMALAFDDDDSVALAAARHKEEGNAAFREKRFGDAVDSFSRASALEPTNWVYFSNRSAAYLALERFEDALSDAKRTIELNSEFAKGYVRFAQACERLQMFTEATDAWKKAVERDEVEGGNNATSYKESLQKAEAREAEALAGNQFTFRGKRPTSRGDDSEAKQANKKKKKSASASLKNTLSFAEEDEE